MKRDDNLPQRVGQESLARGQGNQLSNEGVQRSAPPTWSEIGESFETLGKVGLAMAIGFSAAGLFCRLAEQGKVRVPSLSALVLSGRSEEGARPSSTVDKR